MLSQEVDNQERADGHQAGQGVEAADEEFMPSENRSNVCHFRLKAPALEVVCAAAEAPATRAAQNAIFLEAGDSSKPFWSAVIHYRFFSGRHHVGHVPIVAVVVVGFGGAAFHKIPLKLFIKQTNVKKPIETTSP